MNQKGVIHLAVPLLLFLLLAGVLIVGLAAIGIIKLPKSVSLPGIKSQEPTVTLQTQFKNPFDKGSQYTNPFSSNKNPFDSLK